jgi:hypothetical protein
MVRLQVLPKIMAPAFLKIEIVAASTRAWEPSYIVELYWVGMSGDIPLVPQKHRNSQGLRNSTLGVYNILDGNRNSMKGPLSLGGILSDFRACSIMRAWLIYAHALIIGSVVAKAMY